MKLKIIYKDENILVIDKPPGIVVFPEGKIKGKTLIDYLIEQFPKLKNTGKPSRYGIIHRLDKDTSGILLIAKNNKTLKFLQNQFEERKVIKKYLALVAGKIKENQGKIETLIGRVPGDRRKQKVYLANEPDSQGKREAKTYYKVLEIFSASAKRSGGSTVASGEGGKDYTLLEVKPKTGRKHQIRCHLNWIHHPIAGDKLYGFKNQPLPQNLNRQFLHASYLKVKLPTKEEKEFKSDLPEDLKKVTTTLKNGN